MSEVKTTKKEPTAVKQTTRKTTTKSTTVKKTTAKTTTEKKTTPKKSTTKATTTKKTVKKAPVEVVKKKKPVPVSVENEGTVSAKTKILFVASEARPFIATGGLADVIGSLPQALAQDPSYDIRVVLPLYSDMKPEQRRKLSFMGNIYTPLAWRNQY